MARTNEHLARHWASSHVHVVLALAPSCSAFLLAPWAPNCLSKIVNLSKIAAFSLISKDMSTFLAMPRNSMQPSTNSCASSCPSPLTSSSVKIRDTLDMSSSNAMKNDLIFSSLMKSSNSSQLKEPEPSSSASRKSSMTSFTTASLFEIASSTAISRLMAEDCIATFTKIPVRMFRSATVTKSTYARNMSLYKKDISTMGAATSVQSTPPETAATRVHIDMGSVP
mmetsp:Transcript_134626/g.288065  ORF Transcript_134626/g.288065 Transcript_134626/m.288065 type:complete len:225 (+) Transcript_134626:17-691(+)